MQCFTSLLAAGGACLKFGFIQLNQGVGLQCSVQLPVSIEYSVCCAPCRCDRANASDNLRGEQRAGSGLGSSSAHGAPSTATSARCEWGSPVTVQYAALSLHWDSQAALSVSCTTVKCLVDTSQHGTTQSPTATPAQDAKSCAMCWLTLAFSKLPGEHTENQCISCLQVTFRLRSIELPVKCSVMVWL